MNTKEFVTAELAKPFKKRRIPDALYIRTRTFRTMLHLLLSGEPPENAGFCFDNGFMYEDPMRFISAPQFLYPNVVITQGECCEYSRICNNANGQTFHSP